MTCSHSREAIRCRTVADGRIQVVRQCLDCGRPSNAIPQTPENLRSPAFDEALYMRHSVYGVAVGQGSLF